jgi:hypothetical protein
MTGWQRTLIAVAIVAVDLAAFAVPLTAIVAAYVIIVRPSWFAYWVARLYEGRLQR